MTICLAINHYLVKKKSLFPIYLYTARLHYIRRFMKTKTGHEYQGLLNNVDYKLS